MFRQSQLIDYSAILMNNKNARRLERLQPAGIFILTYLVSRGILYLEFQGINFQKGADPP